MKYNTCMFRKLNV